MRRNKAFSIATLQKQLAASRIGEGELRSYFIDLCRSIGASMIDDPDRLSIATTIDDSHVDTEISVSLGLIVTELVINALKHAFPSDRKGKITVDYMSHGKAWALIVGDDGVGMPPDVGAVKPGLGTGIIDALSKQLDALVTVSDPEPGTSVAITHS